jgi:iron(III) transport system ATP-binding protein
MPSFLPTNALLNALPDALPDALPADASVAKARTAPGMTTSKPPGTALNDSPADSSPPQVLVIEAVTKQFVPQQQPVVQSVSLTLAKGELLALLGPSGCGKTTLLRLVAGFEVPQAGSITLGGKSVCSKLHWLPPEQRDVGIVFQDYALFPHLRVMQNVAFGLQHLSRRRQLPKGQIRTLAQEAINLVGLKGLEERYPHELSGGQQQRVALARALAPRPALILLDEPFSNLDVQVRLYLRQEVRDILKSVGISGIFVTHDQEEALAMADTVAVMRCGQLEQLGSPEAIYREPASRFIAEFVTQANFLAAQRCEEGWQTEIGYFADSALEIDQTSGTDFNTGEIMIRQEDLTLKADEQGALLIRDRQFLGREYQYCLLTPTLQTLKVRTDTHHCFPIGTQVSASVTNPKLRLFASQESSLESGAGLPASTYCSVAA